MSDVPKDPQHSSEDWELLILPPTAGDSRFSASSPANSHNTIYLVRGDHQPQRKHAIIIDNYDLCSVYAFCV